MFANVPVIVISSANSEVGKTTLALNLAAALWQDNYQVSLFAPHNRSVETFIQNRRRYMATHHVQLPMPNLISSLDEVSAQEGVQEVVVADIPSAENAQYASVFAAAHTLISVVKQKNDPHWLEKNKYADLVWQAKKEVAARGIKYLNWIVVPNRQSEDNIDSVFDPRIDEKKYGYRTAQGLMERHVFQCVETGICPADRIAAKLADMTMDDVYARREILQLTAFLWQNK